MTADPNPTRQGLVAFMREKRLAILSVRPWPSCRSDRPDRLEGYVARVGRNGGRIVAEWGRTPSAAVFSALLAHFQPPAR